jgi:thioredoxin reductase (NADPH)
VTLIVPAILGGLAISVMALVSLAAARRGKHPTAAPAPTAQPRILIHAINDDRCTGCDACVAVCPTNVLDLVDNKSRVLRFQDCIQCEACMWACPTEALVMHLEGTKPPKLKMPEIDQFFQTAVKGQYLIGEVAGKPLVKNAANMGRVVVEHMLAEGLRPGATARKLGEGSDAKNITCVDVAIVGSGPGGLSAALTCIQRGLSYVVLEKEQMIASTIARYPKGKLVMAEPYDARNLSLLPVFDSSKEQLIPIWTELIERTGLQVKMGEAVEAVERRGDGIFAVRTTVASYRAQRVVLATGLRGKPRTLGVPGENLPKVSSLLDDPDDFRGRSVLVVGGGDSAVEAAIALADAGARVVISYRGRSFSRAQPKNRQTIESYAGQRRVKIKYQSQIVQFDADTVTLQMADGSQKKYANHAAFVLIGADPPVKWLNKLGVEFVERPHSYSLGKTDDLVRNFVGDRALDCPNDAAGAAAVIAGQAVPQSAARPAPHFEEPAPEPGLEPASGPRKWLRSATSIFTSAKKLEKPMPLSEFARQSHSRRMHTGMGRRDELEPAERTRVLRMLRDEGGRLADEDSRVDIDIDLVETGASAVSIVEDSPMPEPRAPMHLPPGVPVQLDGEESAPKQAVIVGLARAMAQGPRTQRKRRTSPPPIPTAARPAPPTPAAGGPAPRPRRPSQSPPRFIEAATVQDEPRRFPEPAPARRPGLPPPSRMPVETFEEATVAADFDAASLMQAADEGRPVQPRRPHHPDVIVGGHADGAINIDSGLFGALGDEDESTRAVDVSAFARFDAVNADGHHGVHEEATRTIDLAERARSLSDVDWDLD